MSSVYDVLIVGAGPAGLTTAIYTTRYNLDVLVLGVKQGGLIADAHKVCNYPGFPEIDGSELGEKIKDHAVEYGAEVKMEMVDKIDKKKGVFVVKTNFGEEYKAKTVVLATGTERRKLGLEEEDQFLGSGVSYCATCDGRFFENKIVGVVGGSDAAATAALYLSDLAEKVYIVYRRDELRCVEAWKNQVTDTDNIEVVYENEVVSLRGGDNLEAVELTQPYKESKELKLDGLFIEIGSVPNTDISENLGLDVDKKGYIKVSDDQRTSLDGVWAAGDITDNSNHFQQVITANAEGAVAAESIYKYLKK